MVNVRPETNVEDWARFTLYMTVPGRSLTPAGWLGECLYSDILVNSKNKTYLSQKVIKTKLTKLGCWVVDDPSWLEEA